MTKPKSQPANATVAPRPAGRRRATPPAPTPESAAPKGKLGIVVGLLRRPQGARIDDLMAVTAWQAHSVRGAIAGALKTKWQLKVTSEKAEGGRVYRIVDAR